jgi:Tfp pilus assembly protein PilF
MGGDKVSTIRIFALRLSVLTVLAAGCASTGPSPEVQRLQAQNSYERGLSFIKERQAGPALGALQEAVSLDPSRAIYRDTLGVLLLELGNLDQAIVQLSKAVEVDPRLADAHFHLGTALAEARRWEDAVPAYRRAVGLPSLTVPDYAYQNLGLALFHVRKYPEAEQALRFALSLDPKLQAAHYNLGLVLTAQKRPEEAKESFRRARQLGPDSPFGQAAFERLRAMGDRR